MPFIIVVIVVKKKETITVKSEPFSLTQPLGGANQKYSVYSSSMYCCLLVMYLYVLSLHQASLSLGWEGPWGPACHRFRPVWAPLWARLGWGQLWTPRRVQACLAWKTKPPITPVEAVHLKPVTCCPLVALESTLWIILQVPGRGGAACVTVCRVESGEGCGICSVVLGYINFSRNKISAE